MGEPLSPDRVFDFPVDKLEPHLAYDFFAPGPLPGGPSTAAAEGPSFPHSASGLPVPPSVIEDLSTRLGNLEYGHGQLVKKVIQVSDAEVAAGVTIKEFSPRVFAIEGQVSRLRPREMRRFSADSGFTGSYLAERHADSAAADCNFEDGQPGEHTDVVHLGDG
ncbi:hypothetical protein Tco_1120743 [Tanacetum coccineum]